MRFAIYPSIGIARLGDSQTEFFVGPEIPGQPGVEPDGAGGEQPIQAYKHSGPLDLLVKRQAARFRIFEDPQDGTPPRPVQLPAGARIEWTVHLVNKKAAVVRGGAPLRIPTRPQFVTSPQGLVIDPGAKTITGPGAAARFDGGSYRGRSVPLGEVRTDLNQNLLVLGGHGFSSSPINAPLVSFYTNPGWHDDASDGPVAARIIDGNGGVLVNGIEPAWVVVAPPDFAPEIGGFVTLYDVLFQVGVEHFGLQPPARPSFTEDIFPILRRVRGLRWVNNNPVWEQMSDDWPRLADASQAARPVREAAAQSVDDAVAALSDFSLTATQSASLQSWTAGNFADDWTGLPQPPAAISANGLTRAVLDTTVGQGFFPGIEAGIIVKDPTIYMNPFDFRINHASVTPGDLTALMAVPWQADFLACDRSWWPAQRPDDVLKSGASPAVVNWARGIDSFDEMVKKFARLGFVTATTDSAGHLVFAESQRAPDNVFL